MTDYNNMSASEQKKEDWMNSKWRPMMGWLYMLTCTFDFVIFPIMWSMLQSAMGHPVTQWQPLTLQGAGLYHIAMGAVLGLTAFGRTQEKLAGANNGGANTSSTSFSIPSTASSSFQASATSGFSTTNAANNVGGSSNGGVSSTSTPTSQISSTGKPMPVQPNQPEL